MQSLHFQNQCLNILYCLVNLISMMTREEKNRKVQYSQCHSYRPDCNFWHGIRVYNNDRQGGPLITKIYALGHLDSIYGIKCEVPLDTDKLVIPFQVIFGKQ